MDIDQTYEVDGSVRGEWEQQRNEKKTKKRAHKSESLRRIFACDQCKNVFASKSGLDEHIESHRVYNCSQCHENFLSKEELREHEKTHNQNLFSCDKCEDTFNLLDSLKEHEVCHTSVQIFPCKQCDETFTLNRELIDHVKSHRQKKVWSCDKSERSFSEKSNLGEHMKDHEQKTNKTDYRCNKCDKVYGDMQKLRRHDWRCHRSIECTICKKMLNSRQDISSHKESEHRMFRRISCRFYPDCFDENECLFEHNNVVNESTVSGCPNGPKCSDQACSFSEQKHKTLNQNLCRYQARCNRAGCCFMHNVVRQAFLGVSSSEIRKE